MQHVLAEVAARDVDAERQRQPRLEEPPLAEIEDLHEPVVLERELALVDEQARVGAARRNLVRDLLERQLAVRKSPSTSRSARKDVVIVPGTTISSVAQLVERQRLARDDDRPVAGADAGAVRQQGVVLLHERVRGERERGHLEPAGPRPLVERLDVGEDLLELVATRVDALVASAQNMNASSGSGLWPMRIRTRRGTLAPRCGAPPHRGNAAVRISG